MKTVAQDKVLSGGGRHEIVLGVTFDDPDTPAYEHSIAWTFTPTLATDGQTPLLTIASVTHKKYWNELDADPATPTTDDGSDLITNRGWGSDPYSPAQVPASVHELLAEGFGETLASNTIENVGTILDTDLEPVALPEIPSDHSTHIFKMVVKVDGEYCEELPDDDPRITEEDFTSHARDADGNILSTSHMLNHSMSWWFEPDPTRDDPSLRIRKCFHKTWDDAMAHNFDEEYENETVVEQYTTADEAPSVSSLPDDIIETLVDWFGEPLIKTTLAPFDTSVPTRVYECMGCDGVNVVTPRDTCVDCGSDALVTYDSVEHYEACMENETENRRKLKEFLATAEPTVSLDENPQ